MEFEKLGAFYLGKEYEEVDVSDRLVLYDARDLTTHAVCIGMTGSGKTGLCVDLLEEAALDRVPALIIDPKGDITNLLLTFPELRPDDFRPWINPDDARRKGVELDDYAAAQAELWKSGLADWGQDGGRIADLRATTELAIYTPGSDAGIPVSMLSSFAAPDLDWDREEEHLRERIAGTVSGLLGLIGVVADPIQSREHILLATLFEHFWRAGQDMDISTLILSIQNPPVRQLGVFDIDTFFPQKDRMGLAMRLNNLIASPRFASWLEGQPLDIPRFLSAPSGKPRHSIFYIAHLSDAERMFFVTMLLNQVITWMRGQPGTTSLRALLYMDEIFGFLPPVAEPPSKKPFLTLFKQARAYGLGVVLTTQNPADLDYKALTNAGTWFIGRLQTERDKMRVLEGLEAASADAGQALSRKEIDRLISGLDKRVFLLHNVHEDAPVIFKTRWAMSYLRGPLTRSQVSTLMEGMEADVQPPIASSGASSVSGDGAPTPRPAAGPAPGARRAATPPALSPDLRQIFLPLRRGSTSAVLEIETRSGEAVEPEARELVYQPGLVGAGRVHYLHRKSGVAAAESFALLVGPDAHGSVRWDAAQTLESGPTTWEDEAEREAVFEPLPDAMNTVADLRDAEKDLADYLYRSRAITLLHSPDLDEFSRYGESAQDFRLRLAQEARERRDAEVDKVEDRYAKRLATFEGRLRRARQMLAKRKADASARKRETIVSVGETILGAFLGRRSSRAASSTLGKYRQSSSANLREDEAEENVEALEAEIRELREELSDATAEITARWDQSAIELEEVRVTPRRADVDLELVAIGWAPVWRLTVRVGGREPNIETVAAY